MMTSYEIEYYAGTRRHVKVINAPDMAINIARSLDRGRGCRVNSLTRVIDENGRKPKRTPVKWKETAR